MKSYQTAEIADIIGVHPNTIRFYEERALLPPVPRTDSGHRVFSDKHLLQLRFLRCAFRAEILNNNLRGRIVAIVKTAAKGDYGGAVTQTDLYRAHIRDEIARARQAIRLVERFLAGSNEAGEGIGPIGRREAAVRIGVSIHVMRDWERNGLVAVPRKGNRRQYGAHELSRMKIISILRGAGYSQMSIRRMLERLDQGDADLIKTINTPDETEDIISATDRYIVSLTEALKDTAEMLRMLDAMRMG